MPVSVCGGIIMRRTGLRERFSHRIILGLGIIMLVALTVGCQSTTGPTGQVVADQPAAQAALPQCHDVQVPYQDQEEYVQTETYTDTVPYTDTVCTTQNLEYKVTTDACKDRQSGLFGIGDASASITCTITNLDTTAGTFGMTLGFSVGGQRLQDTQSAYIYPQSSHTFTYTQDAKIDQCFCNEQPATKQVCHDVTKYKDVQRERQVTAYRPVTKYRTEQNCS